jgi:hypothetical protein
MQDLRCKMEFKMHDLRCAHLSILLPKNAVYKYTAILPPILPRPTANSSPPFYICYKVVPGVPSGGCILFARRVVTEAVTTLLHYPAQQVCVDT